MTSSQTAAWPQILLFTDFGLTGPYVGQLHSRIASIHRDLRVVDLMHDLPRFSPQQSAILLEAAAAWLPPQCVVCAVVDPGVGSARKAIALRRNQRWFVGPDNGLLTLAAAAADEAIELELPAQASASFHGRDLFAPAAAHLAMGQVPGTPLDAQPRTLEVLRDQIIYVDHYGNAMSGLRADSVSPDSRLRVNATILPRYRTFSDVPIGQPFFYANSWGLIEIAVNQGCAVTALDLAPGTRVELIERP